MLNALLSYDIVMQGKQLCLAQLRHKATQSALHGA